MSEFARFARSMPLIAVALLVPVAVQARVTSITITKTDPAFKGQTFGSAGAYEIVKGTITGELDPADRRNALITDIQFAPRNATGKVAYTTTFTILKPADMSKANGTLVYDVTNRGNPRFVGRFTRFVLAGGPGDLELADPGDGTVYRAGYVVVTSGWQGDLPIASVSAGREGIDVPIARNSDGSPITGPVVVRFAAGRPAMWSSPSPETSTRWRFPVPAVPLLRSIRRKPSSFPRPARCKTGLEKV
jgi:hypothetical protein